MTAYKFKLRSGDWSIVLPAYVLAGGSPADLQMVAGADLLLDYYAAGQTSVSLLLSEKPIPLADVLDLNAIELPINGGGAFYTVHLHSGRLFSETVWLCNVVLFVFGKFPERIYIRMAGIASTT
ncbi:MAG: DUF6717 family protein [Chitinophagaceae bacterium]